MSWIKKRINKEWDGNAGYAPDTEAIAREFAERALRKANPFEETENYSREDYDDEIAKALAAADKDEP